MLRREQSDSFSSRGDGFMSAPQEWAGAAVGRGVYPDRGGAVYGPPESLLAEAANPGDGDDERDAPLDDAAQSEREYVRGRLRDELEREPTEDELDEWLRQHTEGY